MSDFALTSALQATPVCAGRLELFRTHGPRVVIDYARPDGGPLSGADFDHRARLAQAAVGPGSV